MADKSGTIEFPIASSKLQGKIDWTSTSNGASANTSTVVAILYAKRVDGYTTTGQSWSGYVKIQGKDTSNQTNISFGSSVSVGGSWVEMARVTLSNAKHNNDGTGSATISGSVTGPSGTSLAGITSSKSETVTLEKIARGTSITSFTISKRNETSLTFNWATADNVEALYYSTDNGSHWKNANISGTKSGNFTADTNTANNSALSPNTTYQCKIYVVRNTITTYSSQVSQTTNQIPTQWLSSRTETSITMGWWLDANASQIRYSTNNGSSWSSWINVSGTQGTYTINSGLSAGTSYNIKTEVKRSSPTTSYPTAATTVWTLDYPYLQSANSFVIGNNIHIKLYNPLNRSLTIYIKGNDNSTICTSTRTVNGETDLGSNDAEINAQYASIPNSQSGSYKVRIVCSAVSRDTTVNGNTYSVNTSACIPTFSDFAYKDTTSNDLITAIANNQILVQNVSSVNVVISSANKMVAKKSATASKYQAVFSNLSKTFNYSASDIDTNLGVVTGSGNQTFKVTAYDSRNISKDASKSINIVPYSAPVVNVSLNRLNNFEAETKLKVTGQFAKVTVGNEDKNLIKTVKYRQKESTSSTWGSWNTMTIQGQGSGNYQTTEVTLTLDNTKQFDFQVEVTDRAKSVTVSRTVSIGEPLMFLHTNGKLEINANSDVSGTSAGALDVKSSDLAIKQTHATTGKAIGFGVGSGGTNRGCWDYVQQKWLWYDNDSNLILNKFTRIPGAAGDKPLMVRGIAGCDGTATTAGELHLNYGVDAPVKIGKDATTYVQASGMIRGAQAGSWVKDRDNSLLRNAYNGNGSYAPVICQGTKTGSWTIGCLSGEDSLTFNFITDTKYNNNDNTANRYTISTGGYFSGTCSGSNWTNWGKTLQTINGRITNANITHVYDNNKAHVQLLQATSAMTSNKPYNDGYILHFSWDNAGQFNGQLFVPDSPGHLQFRGCSNGTWGGWENIHPIKVLYNNSSGSTGTITLSETAGNFAYLEIFYGKGNTGKHSVKVFVQHNMDSISLIMGYRISGSTVQVNTTTVKISGTSITHAVNGGANIQSNCEIFSGNELSIFKVNGYR